MPELRRATAADVPALTAFMLANAPIAMLPLTNLRDHGLDRTHRDSMRFWMNDPLRDVIGVTNQGLVYPVFTSRNVPGVARAMQGLAISGVIGVEDAVDALARELDLPPAALDRVEGHYEVAVSDLIMPDVAGLTLAHYGLVPRDVLIAWRTAYYIEALDAGGNDATVRAMAQVQTALESATHRVLMKDEVPLSVAGFTAQAGDLVMVGGVYTPPENRGQGNAGKAIALHLRQAAATGVKRAMLSAANAAAAKAYERIGFRRMGAFRIAIFEDWLTIRD